MGPWFRSLQIIILIVGSCSCLGRYSSADDNQLPPQKHVSDTVLDEQLKEIVEKHKIPGLVAGIVKGESLIAVGSAGVRKIGSPQLITVDDEMHLGSCTKAMTTTAIASLVQSQKLRWDSTLAEIFPEELENVHQDFHDVTLTQLLTHRASFPANPNPIWMIGSLLTDSINGLSTFANVSSNPVLSGNELRMTLLRTELKRGPKEKPGTKFQYSNLGYIIAGAMAEKVSGESWETLMRKQLFEPLHMDSAGFGPPGKENTLDQPWGHLKQFGKITPIQGDNPAALGPAGTIHASIPDWAKFAALHLKAARGKAELLNLDLLKQLQTPPVDTDYALGWCVFNPDQPKNIATQLFVHQLGFKADELNSWTGGKALIHNGSNTMWLSWIVILPERDLALLVATNQFGEGAFSGCGSALRRLMEHYEKNLESR